MARQVLFGLLKGLPVALQVFPGGREGLLALDQHVAGLLEADLVFAQVLVTPSDLVLEPRALLLEQIAGVVEGPQVIQRVQDRLGRGRVDVARRQRLVHVHRPLGRHVRDDQVAIDLARAVVRQEGVVVEAVEVAGELPGGRVVIEQERDRHQPEPALEVAVPDRAYVRRARVAEPLLDRGAIGQPELQVLFEVAVRRAEPCAHELRQAQLRLGDPRLVVGSCQDGQPLGHAARLPAERLTELTRHVLEGVRGDDRVELSIREGQRGAGRQHEAGLVGGLRVSHDHQVPLRQVAPQHARPSAYIEDPQWRTIPTLGT